MRLKKITGKVMAGICAASLIVTLFPSAPIVKAAAFDDESANVMIDKTGYKTEIFGTGTYDWKDGIDRKTHLPPSTVYLTDNYKETVGTVPTSDWVSSVVFDKYSESLYVHPLAFRAASNGMQMAAPAVVDVVSYTDGEPEVQSLLKDDSVEMVVGGAGFTAKDARIDKSTDWTYDVVMENSAGNAKMTTTLAKGSPYAYYKFDNMTPEISLGAGATDMAIYMGDTGSRQIGISVFNKTDNNTHYYGIYAPEGTTWTNANGKLTANLPSGKNYISIATLPDNTSTTFHTYAGYAYNFITDTVVDWKYNEAASTIKTTYHFETTNQETGATGGDTIMALYPHQSRYMKDGDFAPYTYQTVRGTMKTVIGNEYQTEMTYGGILPAMPVLSSEEGKGTLKEQIGYYWDYYKNQIDDTWVVAAEWQYGGYDTYWMGKNFNRLSDVILMSSLLDDGDTELEGMTEDMVNGLKGQLEYWFDPYQGYNSTDNYFYYYKDYGTMIGYPAGYGSDNEVNDHHFHYGYWIKAAATVALQDKEWKDSYGGMVYELIDDIANLNRDGRSHNNIAGKTDTKYPFLRNFDIYEGHSWASGVANYEYDENGNLLDPKGGLSGGDNQESSTEAVNAWAALILWGEAVGDTEIRDLGVYLYTTEVAAIEDYYFDVHNEIFTNAYKDVGNHDIQTVTRLWGGRYDHTAWWTEDPIEVTTISTLPMTGATLYLGKYPKKVKAVYDSIKPGSKQWKDYIANKDQICKNYGKEDMLTAEDTHQDILAEYYALYDPEAAMKMWVMSDEGTVEFGDSRAHTYGYIQSMVEYGTPNYEITGSSPLSMVFEKNGEKTYVAYNYSDEEKTVYFSDGTYITVAPKEQYTGEKTGDGKNPDETGDGENPGTGEKTVQYKTEHYTERADGSYRLEITDTLRAAADRQVEAKEKSFAGYYLDEDNASTVKSGTVTADGTLTLKLYYKRCVYTIAYELDGGQVAGTLPKHYAYGDEVVIPSPVKEGLVFEGWYTDAGHTNRFSSTKAMTQNITLYANYYDPDDVTLTLDKETLELQEGASETIIATVKPETADAQTITWSSSNESVATVSNGTVTALSQGTAVIIAGTNGGKAIAECKVTVTKKPVALGDKGVKLGQDGNVVLYVSKTVYQGQMVAFYKIVDTEAEAKAITAISGLPGYEMDNNMEDGAWVYNIGKPDSTRYLVYAFNNGVQEQPIAIAVKDIPAEGSGSSGESIAVTGVSVSPQTLSLTEGEKTVLSATVIPAEATNKNITWSSSDSSIVSVSDSGVVTAGEAGNATITVTTEDGNKTAECEVTVVRTASFTVKFVLDGQTIQEKKVQQGKQVPMPENPEKEGYLFKGWYRGGTLYDFNNPVTQDITLEAQFTLEEGSDNENQVTAAEVMELIDQIGDNVTSASKAAIEAAREAYDALSGEQKAKVENINKLTSAEEELARLEEEGDEKDDPDEEVSKVIDLINSIGNVTLARKEAIEAVREAYNKLTTDQKALVTNYDKLEAAEKTLAQLEGDKKVDSDEKNNTTEEKPDNLAGGGTKPTVKVNSIKITGISKKIAVGKKIKLSATIAPSDATDSSVTWSSSNEKYAAVDENGTVKVKKAGKNKTVTITAAAADGSGVKKTYKIKIMPKAVKKVTLKPAATTVKAGKKVTIKATVTPSNKKQVNTTLKWSSSNTKYATVNKKGLVTTKKAGKGKKVKITAQATDGSNKKKTITIKME